MMDIFAKLTGEQIQESNLRAFSGPDAFSKYIKDEKFKTAFDALYVLTKLPSSNPELRNKTTLTYKDRLAYLAEIDPNVKIVNGEALDMPSYVTDAVMLAQALALDIKSLSSSDRRYTVYMVAEYYWKQAVKIPEDQGREVGVLNGIVEVLGYNFRFTQSPLIRTGFFDPMNLEFNYHAFVPDDRKFEPERYPDQLDKLWQNMFMYCLEYRDPKLRRIVHQD